MRIRLTLLVLEQLFQNKALINSKFEHQSFDSFHRLTRIFRLTRLPFRLAVYLDYFLFIFDSFLKVTIQQFCSRTRIQCVDETDQNLTREFVA